VIFDPGRVQDKATYAQPHQMSEGFDFVLVNGQLAVDDGSLADVRPGKVLRRQ
jgi:N-acyl-D-amino-acid deacylase